MLGIKVVIIIIAGNKSSDYNHHMLKDSPTGR